MCVTVYNPFYNRLIRVTFANATATNLQQGAMLFGLAEQRSFAGKKICW
jgi:hypothetical protein